PTGILPFPISVELMPSPKLKSEELMAYEAGFRRQWSPNWLTDVTIFYNDYERLSTLSLESPSVAFNPTHVILPIGLTNLTEGETFGFEAVANWRARDNLNFSAAYSVLKMNLSGPPSTQAIASEAAEGQSPQQQFNIRSQWDINQQLAFDTTLYYV